MTQALISGLIAGNAIALIAIGISLIFGISDVANFAQGSVFAFGAMLGWWFIAGLHWPFAFAFAGVIVACALLGTAIERFAVRPVIRAPRIAALLATVAVGLILDRITQMIFSPETRAFPSVIPRGSIHIASVAVGYLDLTMIAVSGASVIALWWMLAQTKLGRAMRAAAQDADAARQMGINVEAMQSLAFALSSALAGIAGVLVGMYYRGVEPTMAFNAGIEGFAAAALGGLGSLGGAIAGGLLLGVLQSIGVTLFGGAAQLFVTFAVVWLVFSIRPGGLFGRNPSAAFEPLTGTFFGLGRAFTLPRWAALASIAVAAALPLIASAPLLRVGALVAIFALFALSLTLVAGTSGMISLGQVGLLAVGAYASALLTKDLGWPFWLALPAAGFIAGLVAALAIGPVARLRGHYFGIATLAIGAALVAAILNWRSLTGGPFGIAGLAPPELFGYAIVSPRDYYLLSVAMLIVCIALVTRLQGSQLGLAWRAIREDDTAASASGVDVSAYKALAFALGGGIAGVAGSLLAHQYLYVSPDVFDISLSVLALTIVVLGGMGNPLGTVLGAIVLVGLPELFRPLHDYRLLACGVALLLLVRFRPQGLLTYR
jgi:branched-chain amino acid transport system permease protein